MMNEQPMTAREAYIQASSFLRQEQIPDAAICAELLLQHLLQWDRQKMLQRWDEPFAQEQTAAWRALVERKAAGEPVQYIVGEQEFYGLRYLVTPAVLIPRPETELLVEQIIQRGKALWPQGTPAVVDIGSGSGAIPITLAVQCPTWVVMSSDISFEALEVARKNAEYHDVAERITFVQGDLLETYIRKQVSIDILISNPPYIPSRDIEELQSEVKGYEPRLALDGGPDGLMLYRRMVKEMKQLPAYPRLVGFEVGQGQTTAVAEMLAELKAWNQIEIIEDLAGIARHVIATKG